MSSLDSTVTYTFVSSEDYHSGDEDEREPMFIQPHDPDYVPGPMYPEYIPLEDEHVLMAEEQPLPPVVSPTAESPEDDKDDDDGDSSRDDADDEDEDEEDGEEEEHLALADFAIIIPTDELISPPEGTKPAAISFPPEAEVERFLAIPTPSPSPLTSLSPPFIGERLARCTSPAACPSPPPVPSPLLPSSGCPTLIQTLRLASTQALIDAVTTAILLPALPPPLYIPPPADRRDDILKIEMPPHKRLCLSTLGSRYEIEESSTARSTGDQGIDYGFVSTLDTKARRRGIREVRYGIRDTWIDPVETVHEIAPMTVRERVNLLMKDRIAHQETIQIVEEEAYGACTRVSALGTPETATVVGGCAIENQVKFTTYTLLDAALTWWNSQIRSLGPDAYSITWEVLKKKMADKYCPQGEIKKLEIKLWNLKVKGNDVPAYTECFQELTLIFTKFVANETKKIDKYVNGLPDNIYGSVKASKPKTLDETIENNHGHQQQPLKRKNVAKVYNMGTGEKKPYNGNLPKCHFHYNGPCTQKCDKCNKVGHFAHDCRSSSNANVANAQRNNGANPKGNGYYECGAPGNFKRDCPKWKNYGGNVNAQGWVYAVGNAERK
nr:hypothetical protein [Tanacetum cinerariifolium]